MLLCPSRACVYHNTLFCVYLNREYMSPFVCVCETIMFLNKTSSSCVCDVLNPKNRFKNKKCSYKNEFIKTPFVCETIMFLNWLKNIYKNNLRGLCCFARAALACVLVVVVVNICVLVGCAHACARAHASITQFGDHTCQQ